MKPTRKPKPQNLGGTIKRLLNYMVKRYRFYLIAVIICILISAIVGVVGAMFLQIVIDDYIAPLLLTTTPEFNGLLQAIFVMGGIYLIGIIANYSFNRLMSVVAQGVLKEIRNDLFAHMQKLPIRYFDTHTHGEIMSYYTNDVDTLRQMIAMSLPQMLSSVVTIASVSGAMLVSSLYLSMIVGGVAIIMLFTTKTVVGRSRKFFIKQQEALGKTNGYIEEMINGQKVIKVFCHEQKAKEGFDRLNEELCYNVTQANQFANILMPITGNLGNLLYVALAVIGGGLAINNIGGVTLGVIATFLQLSRTFVMPVAQVSQQLNSVVMALAGAERIFGLMDEQEEEDNGFVALVNAVYENGELVETAERTKIWAWKYPNGDGTFTYTELKGDVRFENVDFSYTEDKKILHDINLFAKPGQKLAFVGATGAGKTTITNLINRFYDIDKGSITYDGIDINEIKKPALRRSLGMVLQDTNLFTGTVMDNIRYGKLNATEQEVIEAAKTSNAHNFISMLPQGYDTMLSGDGSDLSQGQRQLLSIARAAVANHPVMILDEATSSIDTRTESIVQKGMDSLMEGRTVFVIAHRLSTVQNSNAIIVLESGRIIERGDHDDLINQQGKYYQLYTGAFELE